MDARTGLRLGLKGEMILALNMAVRIGHVVIEVVRLATEDAAALLQVGEVETAHPTGDKVFGGLRREAVLDHVAVGALNTFEQRDARNVERDQGSSFMNVRWPNAIGPTHEKEKWLEEPVQQFRERHYGFLEKKGWSPPDIVELIQASSAISERRSLLPK